MNKMNQLNDKDVEKVTGGSHLSYKELKALPIGTRLRFSWGYNVAWGLDESLSCSCILRGFELDSKTDTGRVIIEVDAAGNKIIEDEEGKKLKNENHVISRRGVNLYSVYYDSTSTPTYLEKYGA